MIVFVPLEGPTLRFGYSIVGYTLYFVKLFEGYSLRYVFLERALRCWRQLQFSSSELPLVIAAVVVR